MANKYLDAAGLAKLWELIDAKINSITVEADVEALTNEEIETICSDKAEEEGEND